MSWMGVVKGVRVWLVEGLVLVLLAAAVVFTGVAAAGGWGSIVKSLLSYTVLNFFCYYAIRVWCRPCQW